MEEKLISYDGVAYLKVRSENTPMRNGDRLLISNNDCL